MSAARDGRIAAIPLPQESRRTAPLWTQFWILCRMQFARLRLAWRRYFIVSSAMPLGITILLRIRGPAPPVEALQFVAGDVVLAVALSALTFLAQRVAWMKANRAFDYYRTLPTSITLLLLAIFVSYFAFAIPGMVAIAVIGGLIYNLPLAPSLDLLWLLPTLLAGGIALAGIGALLGLSGRDEQLASMYANLAMMMVLFLGIVPSADVPRVLQFLLGLVPSTYMVDALKYSLIGSFHPLVLTVDLLACAVFAALVMAWSARVLRVRSE